MTLQENIPLAPRTTLGLGGPARYLATCETDGQITEALGWARERRVPLLVLGGGSNLIVPDRGFAGLVLHPARRGIRIETTPHGALLAAEAGEPWDDVVRAAIDAGLAGLECLSGIPGSTGATPMQNVGAYGQEVAETIERVEALEIATLRTRTFGPDECRFGYRTSRFRREDAGRYVITRVAFRLRRPEGPPALRYAELERHLSTAAPGALTSPGPVWLRAVRDAVLTLRRRKSMVVDPADPHSRSAGSFFTNPVVSEDFFRSLETAHGAVPSFPAPGGRKIPAAWLVERAGFGRGYRRGGAGISANHALALVNYDTTTAELLELAARIRDAVRVKFGIVLEREPVLAE